MVVRVAPPLRSHFLNRSDDIAGPEVVAVPTDSPSLTTDGCRCCVTAGAVTRGRQIPPRHIVPGGGSGNVIVGATDEGWKGEECVVAAPRRPPILPHPHGPKPPRPLAAPPSPMLPTWEEDDDDRASAIPDGPPPSERRKRRRRTFVVRMIVA